MQVRRLLGGLALLGVAGVIGWRLPYVFGALRPFRSRAASGDEPVEPPPRPAPAAEPDPTEWTIDDVPGVIGTACLLLLVLVFVREGIFLLRDGLDSEDEGV